MCAWLRLPVCLFVRLPVPQTPCMCVCFGQIAYHISTSGTVCYFPFNSIFLTFFKTLCISAATFPLPLSSSSFFTPFLSSFFLPPCFLSTALPPFHPLTPSLFLLSAPPSLFPSFPYFTTSSFSHVLPLPFSYPPSSLLFFPPSFAPCILPSFFRLWHFLRIHKPSLSASNP